VSVKWGLRSGQRLEAEAAGLAPALHAFLMLDLAAHEAADKADVEPADLDIVLGQIEHIVGMKGARTVVAINNDPKAPIHVESDYSVIGNLYEIVPAFLKAFEKANRS